MNCLTKELGDPVGKWAFPELEPWSQKLYSTSTRGSAKKDGEYSIATIRSKTKSCYGKTRRETLEKEPIYQEIYGKEHTASLNTVLCSSQRNGTRIGSKK